MDDAYDDDYGDDDPPKASSPLIAIGAISCAILVVLVASGGALMLAARQRAMKRHRAARCGNNLRQLGLAAVQYGDDKRFLPHNGPTLELDGDVRSLDTTTTVRALVWYGYHDNPEGFVCGASEDLYIAGAPREVLDNMRLWGWAGQWGTARDRSRTTISPWIDGHAGGDEALVDTSELSYAYTRRGYNRNVSSTKSLAADRGMRVSEAAGAASLEPGHVGNHLNGWNVLKADCTIEFIDGASADFGGVPAYDFLVGTGKGEGFLPLSDVARPAQ